MHVCCDDISVMVHVCGDDISMVGACVWCCDDISAVGMVVVSIRYNVLTFFLI